MAQYIPIQNRWESPRFHCPACGAVVFTENGDPTEKPCEHVLFSWIDQVGDFYNVAEEVNSLVQDEENWCSPSDEEFLTRCPEMAVLFALESSGMACGPVGLTVIHAIKFPETSWNQDDEV